jgi:hypothetical protein
MANGTTYSDRGHLGGETFTMFKPDGTMIIRDKFSQSWQDTMQMVGAAIAGASLASVSKAEVEAAKITDLGAQKAGVANTAIRAEVQKARIAADVEKTLIKHPPEVIPVP